MRVDLFKIGLGFVLLALMFPLVEFTDRFAGSETAGMTLVVWLLGVVLVFASGLSLRTTACSR